MCNHNKFVRDCPDCENGIPIEDCGFEPNIDLDVKSNGTWLIHYVDDWGMDKHVIIPTDSPTSIIQLPSRWIISMTYVGSYDPAALAEAKCNRKLIDKQALHTFISKQEPMSVRNLMQLIEHELTDLSIKL